MVYKLMQAALMNEMFQLNGKVMFLLLSLRGANLKEFYKAVFCK
jgi:hypothetical protein